MAILLLVLLLALILGGLGFAVHLLWWIAIIVLVIWLLGFVIRGAETAGRPREVSQVDTGTTVLGERIPLPIVLSPVGAPRMFHHEGELAVARAARHAGLPYGLSTLATTAVEDVAAQTGTPLWFQLYVWGDRGVVKEAVARAKAAGFRALLFSLDTTVRSKREREKRAGLELPTPDLRVTT